MYVRKLASYFKLFFLFCPEFGADGSTG
uniref:Uncharacterized protein n=1 Tax=Anguilla anguilla TaxID=7936 RepID=A0A0E9QT02_ANGAN